MGVGCRQGVMALGLVVALGGVARAQPTDVAYSPAYARCAASQAAQINDRAMSACIGDEIRVQDARLNRAYQAALARLPFDRQRAKLRKAQRAWILFRDADGDSVQDVDWGPDSNLDAMRRLLWRTTQRTAELEAYRLQN